MQNMKQLLSILLLCMAALLTAEEPVLEAFLLRLKPLGQSRTLLAQYTQTRHISDLDFDLVVKGSFAQEQDKRLAWLTETPLKSTCLFTRDSFRMWDAESGRVNTLNATKYPWIRMIFEMQSAWMNDNVGVKKTKLHYKWAGVQFGGKLPVNISYEFHHAAQWGGYLDGEDLGNGWRAFKHVFLAKSGGSSFNEKYNALGNHVGSQQLALTAKGQGWKVKAYWQNFFEDNFAFIGMGHNLPDGRWGVCAQQTIWPFIHTLTLEYINTTDQSGPMHDQDGIVYAGNDSYYCNSIYRQGWSYFLRTMGTPLITSPLYNDENYTQTLNNRVQAWHVGVGGDIFGYRYRLMATYARNYGQYSIDDWYTMKSDNPAVMLEVNKEVQQAWGLDFGVRVAADFGSQWGNQVSAMITVTKKGLITKW